MCFEMYLYVGLCNAKNVFGSEALFGVIIVVVWRVFCQACHLGGEIAMLVCDEKVALCGIEKVGEIFYFPLVDLRYYQFSIEAVRYAIRVANASVK